MEIEIGPIVQALRSALPHATPNPAALMFLELVPNLDAQGAGHLVDQLGERFPPDAWYFEDDRLDRWPEPAVAAAMKHIRGLEPGWRRIQTLCLVARRLTDAERGEALDGVLDGTLAGRFWSCNAHGWGPDPELCLLAALPPCEGERWVRGQIRHTDPERRLEEEVRARTRLEPIAEETVRQLYRRVLELWPEGSKSPMAMSSSLLDVLPSDLRADALERIRLASDTMLRSFSPEELTQTELQALTQLPENPHRHSSDFVRHLLPSAPAAVLSRWVDFALSLDDYDLQVHLNCLLPMLQGELQERARQATVDAVLRDGQPLEPENSWSRIAEQHLGPMLYGLRMDSYGWHRDHLITHIIEERDPACAERCFAPILRALDGLPPDHRLEIVAAMLPWLAKRSGDGFVDALAELPVQASDVPSNEQFMVARVHADSEGPEPSGWASALRDVAVLFAQGNFGLEHAAEHVGQLAPAIARQVAQRLEGRAATLVPNPNEMEVPYTDWLGDCWLARFPLWVAGPTENELVLFARVTQAGGTLSCEVEALLTASQATSWLAPRSAPRFGTRFCNARFVESSATSREASCAELRDLLLEHLTLPRRMGDAVRESVAQLRDLGHDLWSFDEVDGYVTWCPNWSTPDGKGLKIVFSSRDNVTVAWSDS